MPTNDWIVGRIEQLTAAALIPVSPVLSGISQIVMCDSGKHALSVLKSACPFCEIERLRGADDLLKELQAALKAAWDAGTLPDSVISTDLAGRVSDHLWRAYSASLNRPDA